MIIINDACMIVIMSKGMHTVLGYCAYIYAVYVYAAGRVCIIYGVHALVHAIFLHSHDQQFEIILHYKLTV